MIRAIIAAPELGWLSKTLLLLGILFSCLVLVAVAVGLGFGFAHLVGLS